ncbi:MAG: prepilin-type N-terminal cleavage/methylation domain-containing protein [Bacilli bacterium]|jgi:type IV pilus assembly protein PilA|nr:prepilin-type N-terminal cleavage/methylation domain-containing protein [Bacilli bacterium]
MKRTGFTLIELLAVIVIIGIIMLIAVPAIVKIIGETEDKVFITNETLLQKAGESYFLANKQLLPKNVNDQSTVYLVDLVAEGLLKKIKNPVNEEEFCDGYVIVERMSEGPIFEYKSYLKCGDDYMTEGYINL